MNIVLSSNGSILWTISSHTLHKDPWHVPHRMTTCCACCRGFLLSVKHPLSHDFVLYFLLRVLTNFLEAWHSSDIHYRNSIKKQGSNASINGTFRQLPMATPIKDALEEIEPYKRTFFSPVRIFMYLTCAYLKK